MSSSLSSKYSCLVSSSLPFCNTLRINSQIPLISLQCSSPLSPTIAKTSSTSFPYQNDIPVCTSFSSPFPNLSSVKLPNFSLTRPFIQNHEIHLSASFCLSILILLSDIPFLWFGLFTLDRSCFCKTTLKDGERVA